jgi:hypothetical protein
MNAETIGAVERSIISSLKYILSHQSANGSWVDWSLPTGESDAWTTAFLGYKLASIPKSFREIVIGSMDIASEWLLGHRHSDEGWGFNDKTGSDADSTAHAILFLASCGATIPERSYERLKEFQGRDGGFSTYSLGDGFGSWTISHPDVTPVVLLAFLTKHEGIDSIIRQGIDYVLRQRSPEGLWNSFWWDSPLYSTEKNLMLLNSFNVYPDKDRTLESLLQIRPKNAFERALMISSILYADPRSPPLKIRELLHQLLVEQQPDGSWRSEPILRLANNSCSEPWNCRDCCPLFADPHNLFTSATVLGSLSKAYELDQNVLS